MRDYRRHLRDDREESQLWNQTNLLRHRILSHLTLTSSHHSFRIVYVRHFHQLRGKFPILDKTMYWTANKELGVGLRRFQQFFWEHAEDKLKVDEEEMEELNPTEDS